MIVDGTRLVAPRIAGEPFFDRELDTPCEFELCSGGVQRCLPTSLGPVVYSDSDCTVVLGAGLGPRETEPPRFAPLGDCVFQSVGERVEVDPAMIQFQMGRDRCVGRAVTEIYALEAAPLPETAFVAGGVVNP